MNTDERMKHERKCALARMQRVENAFILALSLLEEEEDRLVGPESVPLSLKDVVFTMDKKENNVYFDTLTSVGAIAELMYDTQERIGKLLLSVPIL